MTERIAVVDIRLPNQHDDYRADLPLWVTGARSTLQVGATDRNTRIIDWVIQQARRFGGVVDLDLLAHGGGADHEGRRIFWLRLGGQGISPLTIRNWRALHGYVRKIRCFSCGVASSAYPPAIFRDRLDVQPAASSPKHSQHMLMADLCRGTGATVKYSLNTHLGAVVVRGGSQAYIPDRIPAPAYIVSPPEGFRRQLVRD